MNGAAGESTQVVRWLVDELTIHGDERQVSTDQANLSVAVDERYLVKWFRTPVEHDRFTIVEHLSSVGFGHMPRFLGVADEGGRVVAAVSELVPGATDGWQWYVDDVLRWIDGSAPLDGLVQTAARVGAITAELHVALVGERPVLGPVQPLRDWAADRRRIAVEHTTGAAGERLRARLDRIDEAISVLDSLDDVPVQRVHGDLHAGQFLRAGDRLLVIDFDGDPMAASGAAPDLLPVERDVAGLLQSLDHVGRVAARRRRGCDVAPFIEPAITAATDAYRRRHPLDDTLLFALRVAQELHEYAYAATMLPVWGYVPDEAMGALLPGEDGAR